MRFPVLAALLLACAAAPVAAQQPADGLNQRVKKLEGEMRAVQRKVFPGGAAATLEPEITPQTAPGIAPGVPASSALADLTARIDALEAQLATITGQNEQNAFRLRQLEEALNQFKGETETRFSSLRGPAAAPEEPAPEGGPEPEAAPAEPEADEPSATGDAGEAAYLAGFRLWEQKKLAEAQKALEAMAKQYPKHRRASYARNLAGRAYLDEGKPATAAKILLSNYQIQPKGDRAADSLYFLGQALVSLKKPADACKVYDELQDVYGPAMRGWVKQRLPKARTDAKCA